MPTRRLIIAAAVVLSGAGTSAQPAPPLTVERVASLPSLIGTPPASPTWSPDSARLAFRWNDAGWPFRDIWIVGADGTGLRRVTDLQRTDPAAQPPQDMSTKALAARAAARASGGVSEMIWLPDGTGLLFVLRGRLYRVILDDAANPGTRGTGSRGTKPEALPLDDGVSDIALSPDGTRLSFLRDGDLWLWPIDARSPAVRLTSIGVAGIGRVPLGTYNRADREVGTGVWGADWLPYTWSPDGATIAFHHVDRRHIRQVPFPSYLGDETIVSELRRGYPGDENERRAVSLIDVLSGDIRDIPLEAPGYRAISDFAWSRDGRLLIDQVADNGTERWVWVVGREDAAPRLAWHDRRDSRIYPAYVARWHSDGRRIVLVADIRERDHLYSLDTASLPATPVALTSGEWDVAGERGAATVQVTQDGDIVFTATLKSPYERQVYRVSAAGGRPDALTTLPGVHQPVVSPDGRRLATLWSDDVTPTELLVSDLAPGAEARKVTTSPPPGFTQYGWVRARYETFTNKVDGFPVHARILEPGDIDRTKRYPVIFGPVYSNTVRNHWGGLSGTLQQFLVRQGYIVVQVDVRGSVGYGRRFREAFLMDYGGRDLDDLQAVADGLRGRPYVDGARMGIWGSSYGGLLTVHALLERPGLFAAGVAGAPAVDPHAFGPDDVAITRSPRTHPEAFVRGSALALGERLRDHLLIIHGLMDDVVPFRTTMALVERLILLGKDVDLATAPAATHAWTAREPYAVYFYRKLVQYFDRYLQTQGGAPRPLDWSADDGARVERLAREGTRLEGAHAILWFPPSLSRADGEALLQRLDPAVAALGRKVGRHDWQAVGEGPVTYYLSDDAFVSHATGRAAVFIPMARVNDGRAPFLHEATHELLAARPAAGSAGPGSPARRPLWLSEGLPDYIAQSVAAETGFAEGDVFAIGGLGGADAACAERAGTVDGASMLRAIGTLERPAGLFTTDRARFAPTFYACSLSFSRFLVNRLGLERVVAIMGEPPDSTLAALERAAGGRSVSALAGEWRRAIGAP